MSGTKPRLKTSSGGVFKLSRYQFPESREKFNVFVDGRRTQAARTHGIGKNGDVRNYTYLRINGVSMYVATWLDADAVVSMA